MYALSIDGSPNLTLCHRFGGESMAAQFDAYLVVDSRIGEAAFLQFVMAASDEAGFVF